MTLNQSRKFSMSLRRLLLLGPLVTCSLLAAGASARADYVITTGNGGTVPFGTTPQSNLILTGQPATPSLNGSGLVNIQDVEIQTVKTTPPGDVVNPVNFTFTLNLTQTVGNGSTSAGAGSTTFTGSLNVQRADIGNEISFLNTLTAAPIVIGNTTYTFSNPTYAAPVVNSLPNSVGAGNFTVLVTPTFTSSIPEPSSVILLGSGLAGVVGFRLRRNKKA